MTTIIPCFSTHASAVNVSSLGPTVEKFLEIAIVADATFVAAYQGVAKAEKYILVLMKMVSRLFDDESLDARIRLSVKKVKLLEQNVTELMFVRDNARLSMQLACKYLLDMKDKEMLNFDFGIVLTKQSFGYAGFTPIYQMCDPGKSCTLVRDSGPQTAFIIAHEIGHSMGLEHDGQNNDCQDAAGEGSIMSPVIYSRFDRYFWSNCSSLQIRQTLDYFPCIHKMPTGDVITKFQDELPGVSFDLDAQCELYMGVGSKSCLGLRDPDQHCRYVFCRLAKFNLTMCSYWSLPPIDGTQCASGKWCIKGQCLPAGYYDHPPVNGGWSVWGRWGSCSSSCGTGVRYRYRQCDNPKPAYKGNACVGSDEDWTLCSTQKCEMKKIFADDRQQMCFMSSNDHWDWLSPSVAELELQWLDLNCSFEHGLCGWKQSAQDNFDWTLHQGKTPTELTGPSFDHTFKNDTGSYIYMEASHWPDRPRLTGDKTVLVSRRISVPRVCLRFAYHMFGKRVGSLQILQLVEGESRVVWTKTGDHGDQWFEESVEIISQKPFEIGLEAIRGNLYLSDIAVDDVAVSAGTCNTSGDSPCRLSCRMKDRSIFKLDKVVADGLPCSDKDSSDICVRGNCHKVGCDGLLGSLQELDQCGVCGGSGDTCLYFDGELGYSPLKGGETVITIPKHAFKLMIAKVTSSAGQLALYDASAKKFVMYDDMASEGGHYFSMADATFRYLSRANNRTAMILGDGVTSQALQVQVLFPDSAFDRSELTIQYSFFIQNTTDNTAAMWYVLEWGNCSKACGGGLQTASIGCIRLSDGHPASNESCGPSSVQHKYKTRSCNARPCALVYRWRTSLWAECASCGQLSTQARNVSCALYREESGQEVAVSHTLCDLEERPPSVKQCWVPCAPKAASCVERSLRCPQMARQRLCSFGAVRSLCCKTCASHAYANTPAAETPTRA